METVSSRDACLMDSSAVLEALAVDDVLRGLSQSEVARRRAHHPANELEIGVKQPLWQKFMEQFKDPMIALLLASAFISLLVGQNDDAFSIMLAVVIVVTVAFIQEYRSDKSLEALNSLAPPQCTVLRNGNTSMLLARDLVPGDIVIVRTGDRIPADTRLLEATDLHVDESSLTGETMPLQKDATTVVPGAGSPMPGMASSTVSIEVELAERSNICFMGTLVRQGHGRGVVISTGSSTELGLVFSMMQDEDEVRTPLQLRMDALGKRLSALSLGVIGVIVLIGLFQGKQLLLMFQIGVSLAVAAIPEGLPIVVTVTLALGVMRMAKHNAVVKKLPAVEALGCATVICCDKTGTLTRNEMTVRKMYSLAEHDGFATVNGRGIGTPGVVMVGAEPVSAESSPHWAQLLEAGAVCNNSTIDDGVGVGNASELALLDAARKFHVESSARYIWERTAEVPFSSLTKWMAVRAKPRAANQVVAPVGDFGAASPTVVVHGDAARESVAGETFFVKGAPRTVLEKCTTCLAGRGGEVQPLSEAHRAAIRAANEAMAREGLRVLCVASGPSLSAEGSAAHKDGLCFLGLTGLQDPPRDGIEEAVSVLRSSGVRIMMVTGDALETAYAIGTQLGIIDASESMSMVGMSGRKLASLSAGELVDAIEPIKLLYRVAPQQKMDIVKALQKRGETVAMTGDGVNDAPALKAAEIGIAMGLAGTDVAKEAADMILLDDNFATILPTIAEGKGIYMNTRHFVRFQVSTSVAALALVAVATALGMPNPLNAMQILWINIIMDGPPAQSLGVEPVDDDIRRGPPLDAKAAIVSFAMLKRVALTASVVVVCTMFVFVSELADGVVTRRDTTMTFSTFVLFDMWNALSCRSELKSIASIDFLGNKAFLFAAGGSILGQLLVVYFPPLQSVFQTEALSFMDWVYIVSISSLVLVADEAAKAYLRSQSPNSGEARRAGSSGPPATEEEERVPLTAAEADKQV